MKLYSHPVLKIRTKDRLHISKEHGLLSWMSVLSVTLTGVALDYYVIPDSFVLHAGFLSLCLILSLNIVKTWDLIMDRDENLGTMINRSWYHIFCIRVPEENVQRFKLSAISSVLVTSESSIDINSQNGLSIKIKSESNNFRLLKKLRNEISVFLCLERIEYLTEADKEFYKCDVNHWSSSSNLTEIQESDNEILEGNSASQEIQFQYGSNIKIITGVL